MQSSFLKKHTTTANLLYNNRFYIICGLLLVCLFVSDNNIIRLIVMIVLGILLAIESYRIQEKTPAQIKLKNKKLVTVIATGTMWIFFMTLLFTMYALTGTNHHTQEHLELYGNTAHDHHD